MLKPEAAKQQLEAWQLPEGDERLDKAITKLSAALRDHVWAVQGRDVRGKSYRGKWEERDRRRRAAGAALDRLGAAERAKVFALAAPHLVVPLEATWQLLRNTPYQSGGLRKAFRAPGHPIAAMDNRLDFLESMFTIANRYRPEVLTPAWLAAWAPHLDEDYGDDTEAIGRLLAATIDLGGPVGEEVFQILCQTLRREHEIGVMGRHVTRGLLLANRPDGWELVEKTLLAAQRQEGLRQAILESVDEAHPGAFRRLVRAICDNDLGRFSSVVRAMDVWLGVLWGSGNAKKVHDTLGLLLELLDDEDARQAALKSNDAEAVYLALWATAYEDALAAVSLAAGLLGHRKVEVRFAAVVLLARLGLPESQAARLPAIDDEDVRVALVALGGISSQEDEDPIEVEKTDDLFERIERLLPRLPEKPKELKPLVWPWASVHADRGSVAADLLPALGKRPSIRLLPHLRTMESWQRGEAVKLLGKGKKWDPEIRTALFDLAGDASADVREEALVALERAKLQAGEAEKLEGYLKRKADDLRRGAAAILLNQKDADVLASADRLLAAKSAEQRAGGLELLRRLGENGREIEACRTRAAAYRAAQKKPSIEELRRIEALERLGRKVDTLDDALGLMNPAERTPVTAPVARKVPMITPAAVACLNALDELVHQHRKTPLPGVKDGEGGEALLGTSQWAFPSPTWSKPRAAQREKWPLREVWETWETARGKAERDTDGLELLRAAIWCEICDRWDAEQWREWVKHSPARCAAAEVVAGGQPILKLRYPSVVSELLDWFLFLTPPDAIDYLLDAVENAFAQVPPEEMKHLTASKKKSASRATFDDDEDDEDDERIDWRRSKIFSLWPDALEELLTRGQAVPSPAQARRHWLLMHWCDEPIPGARRERPDLWVLTRALAAGAANLADLADELLGPRHASTWHGNQFDSLRSFTERVPREAAAAALAIPGVRELVERCRARLLELELARGEAPTAASAPALELRSLPGAARLLSLLTALGATPFKTTTSYQVGGQLGRTRTLTLLVKMTFPGPDDTPESFAALARTAVDVGRVVEERLLQLAFLAPQWATFLERFFGWEGFAEGIYWYLAHMRYAWGVTDLAASGAGMEEDQDDGDDEDDEDDDTPHQPKLSAWDRLIQERTPLTPEERAEGAVDVAWFRRTFEVVGAERWQALAAAARFAASAAQGKRAKRVGDVLLGEVNRKELLAEVQKKKLKDAVRLLGLLPLAEGAKRDADLKERCQALREYRRYAGGLSALSKPEALRAVEIGLQNLAATAGYADPMRLEWAVGAEAVKDLLAGPVSVTKGGVTVTLSLDEGAQPTLKATRGDQELSKIPPDVKKDRKVQELTERLTDLKRQASGVRKSLEAAMCRSDGFTGEELTEWCGHALLAPLLTRLVLIGDGGVLGYPDRGGRVLRDHAGKLEPVKPGESLRIAHPHDLLKSGDWAAWQHECFHTERLQPFKQVFRELYVVTKQEKQDGTRSRRYAGQQVQPRQAHALWGQRGWSTVEGVSRTFHHLGLTVQVSFNHGTTTPLEVEGLTIGEVTFHQRGQTAPLKLTTVPPAVFSEVMRDLDLVVSVAHVGGVDPEASASTVEMRGALIRETCGLLSLKNVKVKGVNAVIDGQLANYRVHLGSATVHRMPGGALCVVPVHSQHRGRLFLPFADDDPRSAEVLAKVLLLARDGEIQDPAILEQIRG